MKNFIGFLLVIILMSSCSEYQKLLKSGDSQAMYKKAVEYYNNGDYTKASNLFDGIRMVFQGTSKAQSVAYTGLSVVITKKITKLRQNCSSSLFQYIQKVPTWKNVYT